MPREHLQVQRAALGPGDTLRESTREGFKLFEQARDSEPKEYAKFEPILILSGQMALALLGYGTRFSGELDTQTTAAVAAYQERRGLPVNGRLFDPLTYDLLEKDSEEVMKELAGIRPPFLKVFVKSLWDRGWFSARGGWGSSNQKLIAEVQAAYIECDRSVRECSMHLAQITDRRLGIDPPEVYKITSWDEAEIRAIKDYPCARYNLVISRPQETVEGTRTTLSRGTGCEHMDAKSIQLELYGDSVINSATAMREHVVLGPRLRKVLQPSDQERSK
jgi:hypothetical protein